MEKSDQHSQSDIRAAFKDDQAVSAFLSDTRKEMYDALSLFYTHVKHTVSLMLTLMTAVFAIFGVALGQTNPKPEILYIFKTIGGVILLALFPLGIVSILIIARYYKLYVAALIYSADLHASIGLDSHSWFQQIKEDLESLPRGATEKDLLYKRTYGWPHSWILYSSLIIILSILSFISGIFIFMKI